MAQEFTPADLSPDFPQQRKCRCPRIRSISRWSQTPSASYQLKVDGLVAKPASFSLPTCGRCRAVRRSRATTASKNGARSANGRARKLSALLDQVQPAAEARDAVLHRADPMEANGSSPYYESIDMDDAYHAQTLLAYELNDTTLPVANGAPIRLRVERQLGYKHAKYVMRLELGVIVRQDRRWQGRLLGIQRLRSGRRYRSRRFASNRSNPRGRDVDGAGSARRHCALCPDAPMPDSNLDRFYRYAELTTILKANAAELPASWSLSRQQPRRARDLLLTVTQRDTGPASDKPAFWVEGNVHVTELAVLKGEHAFSRLPGDARRDRPRRRRGVVETRAFHTAGVNSTVWNGALAEEPVLFARAHAPIRSMKTSFVGDDQGIDGDGLILQMRIPMPTDCGVASTRSR